MAVNLREVFGGNKKSEKEGIWIEVHPGVKFLVARCGGHNFKYEPAFIDALASTKGELLAGQPREEWIFNATATALAKACIFDWTGVGDENGEEIPYSEEACIAILRDVPDVCNNVYRMAADNKNYQTEEDVKN